MLTFNFIRLMWRLKFSCGPNIVNTLLTLICVLRILLMTQPVELMDIRLPPYFLNVKLVDVVVVFLGVLVFIETFLSIITLCSSGMWGRLRNQANYTSARSYFVYLLMVCSTAHVYWLFYLVRTVWVQHYGILVQMLHVLPPLMLLGHMLNGDLFILANQQHSHLSIARKEYLTEKVIARELMSHWKYCTPLVIYFITMIYVAYSCSWVWDLPTGVQTLIWLATIGNVANHVYSAKVIYDIGDCIHSCWIEAEEESAEYDPEHSVMVNVVEGYSGEEYRDYIANLCVSNVFVTGHGPGSEMVT